MAWIEIAMIVLLVMQNVHLSAGYGEADANGHPNYQERANHVFLNAVRIAPSQYKTTYMAGYSPSPSAILGSTYPAVAPVYMEPKLINAAYAHSLDMATNGCFSHNSCDGTDIWTRIGSYYTCSGTKAENIAAGYQDPLDTNNQWLCDKVGSACAADASSGDGHRKNIMSGNYKAAGVGYAYSASSTYKHYWTQDFGGAACSPAPTNPVYSASHRVNSGNTKFIAVYYTSPAVAPSTASVVISGTSYALSFEIGTAGAGTYVLSQTAGTGCRPYYFTFGSVRFPDTGCLVTYGEGTCTASFDATCGGTTAAAAATTTTTTAAAATTAAATTAAATTAAATTAAATTAAATSSKTSTTKASTTKASTTKAATTKVATTTTAAATGVSTTGGSSGVYYVYSSSLQNSWTSYANSGAPQTQSFVYSGRTGLKVVLTGSGSSTFVWFDHSPVVTNVWTNLKFYVAAGSSGSVLVYFNGGYYVSKTVSTAWTQYTIALSTIGNPDAGGAPYTAFGNPKQLIFQNGGSSSITLYLSDVSFV